MIPGGLEGRMRLKLQALKAARGIEFTVLTINSMRDYGHTGAIEPFATGLFNTWGIGNAETNDGVLLLVSRRDRQLRIELGAGYGNALNQEMKEIIDTTITPEFRNNAYYAGIDAGINKIIYAVAGRYPGEYDASLPARMLYAAVRFLKATVWWIVGIGSPFALYYGIKGYRHYKRTKPRICRVDGSKMYWMTEYEEDEFLTQGQILEEELKAIDHDVWACRKCDHIRVEAYPTWFSDYKMCPNCSYKTQFITKTTDTQPTRTSVGYGTAVHQCKHCDHTYATPFTIPKLADPSSGGSSGGRSSSSSFGGGRSSGGGASGSW